RGAGPSPPRRTRIEPRPNRPQRITTRVRTRRPDGPRLGGRVTARLSFRSDASRCYTRGATALKPPSRRDGAFSRSPYPSRLRGAPHILRPGGPALGRGRGPRAAVVPGLGQSVLRHRIGARRPDAGGGPAGWGDHLLGHRHRAATAGAAGPRELGAGAGLRAR